MNLQLKFQVDTYDSRRVSSSRLEKGSFEKNSFKVLRNETDWSERLNNTAHWGEAKYSFRFSTTGVIFFRPQTVL